MTLGRQMRKQPVKGHFIFMGAGKDWDRKLPGKPADDSLKMRKKSAAVFDKIDRNFIIISCPNTPMIADEDGACQLYCQ